MNKLRLVPVLFLIILFNFSQSVFAQTSKATQIDDLIKPFVEKGYFSGVVFATENGKVIYEKAYGFANADYRIPNQPDTRIGIASITKPMTMVVLYRLIEEKKIGLAETVDKYVPGFPNGDKITVEMLASHRSGIPHRVMPREKESMPYTSVEMVENIAEAKLEFEPGTESLYSSAGYSLLARILEIASGKSFSALLEEFVFDPARMRDSLDFEGEKIMERRAQDYLLRPEGYINARLMDYSFLIGAGSVFSTARDVHKFGEALLDGRYGKAVRLRLSKNDAFGFSGRTNGHRAYLEIDKEKRYGYVILSNLASGAFDIISQGVTEVLTGKELTFKSFQLPNTIKLSEKELAEFEGTYKRTSGSPIVIVLKDGVLRSGTITIYPSEKDCFFDLSFFGQVCFTRDDSNTVKTLVWKGINFGFEGKKQ
ncbi:MAG: beta-lactamase family protein [Pyrinomonadaceae bacterium]|nr:beta-lactamase family protein [Pyrinomonadaceae bacterium]